MEINVEHAKNASYVRTYQENCRARPACLGDDSRGWEGRDGVRGALVPRDHYMYIWK